MYRSQQGSVLDYVIDRLIRHLVACAKAVEADMEDILAAAGQPQHPGTFSHENYAHGAHVLLALHAFGHPSNPHFGSEGALTKYCRLVETWADLWDRGLRVGPPHGFAEWPPFITCRGLELAGDRLDPSTRARWERFVTWFVEDELPQPFFSTSPNHEVWKLLVIATAGRLLGRPEWVEQAVFECGQLIAYQTPEGFWEEGRHHGPSTKYNSLMLDGLALLARETGDDRIRRSAEQLARFMVDWCFPDGVTVGTFDGRQSTSPGYFGRLACGLELAPAGLTHMRRILEFWERAGWLEEPRAAGPSNWYAYFGMPFAGEALLYYGAMAELPEAACAPLPLEAPAADLENHTPHFDGVMLRRGPWVVAVSGQLSDVPKDMLSIYRLERQSRIELWHQGASVVLGGGHNLMNAVQPLYNAWVDSGYWPDPGEISPDDAANPTSAMMRQRRSRYFPRAAASGTEGDTAWLELSFAHASVRFEIAPDGDDVTIRYRYRAVPVRELRLALPMLLWRGSSGSVDDRPLAEAAAAGPAQAKSQVRVDCPMFGSTATLQVPAAGLTRVRYPLWPARTYGKVFDEERFDSYFSIALVETVLPDPGREGSGQWTLEVESP